MAEERERAMTTTLLRDGVRRLLEVVRNEEWTFDRALTEAEREQIGGEGTPEIKELVNNASAGRRRATEMLHKAAAERSSDGCVDPQPGPVGRWPEVHREAHDAMSALHVGLELVDEDRLAGDVGPQRSHPQYLWRDVAIYAARMPILSYADWHQRHGRELEAIGLLSRWYEGVRGSGLPAKALSDASYDLACGLARAGRLDTAMEFLPDAFTYNDRAAVPILKAWAREDRDLAALHDRPEFRTLVNA
jgi:hypothetical protein